MSSEQIVSPPLTDSIIEDSNTSTANNHSSHCFTPCAGLFCCSCNDWKITTRQTFINWGEITSCCLVAPLFGCIVNILSCYCLRSYMKSGDGFDCNMSCAVTTDFMCQTFFPCCIPRAQFIQMNEYFWDVEAYKKFYGSVTNV